MVRLLLCLSSRRGSDHTQEILRGELQKSKDKDSDNTSPATSVEDDGPRDEMSENHGMGLLLGGHTPVADNKSRPPLPLKRKAETADLVDTDGSSPADEDREKRPTILRASRPSVGGAKKKFLEKLQEQRGQGQDGSGRDAWASLLSPPSSLPRSTLSFSESAVVSECVVRSLSLSSASPNSLNIASTLSLLAGKAN